MANIKNKFEKLLNLYDYELPKNLIAQEPASPRDLAKLLVYDRNNNKIHYDIFAGLAEFLPRGAILVFNETKVLPASLLVKKETGGSAKILYVGKSANSIRVLSDKKLPANSRIRLNEKIYFTVGKKSGKHYLLRPSFPARDIFRVLEKYGQTPIPPYIKHSPLSERKLKEKYQTVFARRKGSVAAPTASLHFTESLLKRIKKSGRIVKFVTLHVNLGTFAPLTEENIRNKKLHEEYYEINKKTAEVLNRAKKENHPIIAVGTTVARTLESAADDRARLKKISGTTDIFIREGYKFKFIDGLITNFHVPRSSLMMLVAALIGRKKLLKLYQMARKRKFRFFSFGDGMLIV